MPRIKLYSYDNAKSATINLKENFIASRLEQNRWGNKFKKLFLRHREHRLFDENGNPIDAGRYDFTQGMRAVVNFDYDTLLEDLQSFKSNLLDSIKVKDEDGNWGVAYALHNSYIAIELEKIYSITTMHKFKVNSIKFSLSIDKDGGDGRRISYFKSSGTASGIYSKIKPKYSDDDTLILYDAYGNIYSHSLKDGTKQSNILDIYGYQDNSNEAFASNQDDKFNAIWSDLEYWLKDATKQYANVESVGDKSSIVIGLKQFLNWIDRKIDFLTHAQEGTSQREKEDIELIDHLDMRDALIEQIDEPDQIEHIYYRFYKKINPPTTTDEQGHTVVDKDYKWWEEEQFNDRIVTDDDGKEHKIDGISSLVKDWRDYVEVVWGDSAGGIVTTSYVTLKKEFFDLPGWKIYQFCRVFLDIEVDVEEPGFFEMLLNFFIAGVMIYFTWMSGMPTWLSFLASANIVMGALGINLPELTLITTVATLGYGIYSANFSAFGAMDMFKFAIKNVELVLKAVSVYEAIGAKERLEAQAKEEAKRKSLAQLQNETITYIYTNAYSQYDNLYSSLYQYEPIYIK